MTHYPRITVNTGTFDPREHEIIEILNELIPVGVIRELSDLDIGILIAEWSEDIEEKLRLFNEMIETIVMSTSLEVFLNIADAAAKERKQRYH